MYVLSITLVIYNRFGPKLSMLTLFYYPMQGKLLTVEFLRLQASDPSVASAIQAKEPISLRLIPKNPLIAASAAPASTKRETHRKVSSSSAPSSPRSPSTAKKMKKMHSTFDVSNSSISNLAKEQKSSSNAPQSPRLFQGTTETDLPIIEQVFPPDVSSTVSNGSTPEVEHVEELDIDYNKIAPLVPAEQLEDGAIRSPLPDLSRQSVSLDGDEVVSLSLLPPPATISRFSMIHPVLPGTNRLSNMPRQIHNTSPEEQAKFDEIMQFFSQASEQTRSKAVAPSPTAVNVPIPHTPSPLSPRSPMVSPRSGSSHHEITAVNMPVVADLRPTIQIDAPSLVASTYQHHSALPPRLQPVPRPFPVRLATTATAIGAPKPETTLCFKVTAENIGKVVAETGRRILDFVPSPLATGQFIRRDRLFEACVLPAGPQLIRADLDYERWRMVCNAETNATALMRHVLLIPAAACCNYILRICGTTEYLLENDRPLVDYFRLRLQIRDRRRIELLCEDRAGARISQAIEEIEKATTSQPIPSNIVDPYFGLKTHMRDMADVSCMDGHLRIKVHALEHFNFDVLREYLDVGEASFAALKSGFEASSVVPAPDMTFSVEFSLVYNNVILEATQRTTSKPSPMWVEQVKFPFNWTQLPRELRVLVRVVFRKSKTSRPFIIGEVCAHLFDVYGVLTTGKHSLPILPIEQSQRPQHAFSSTIPVSSVYKSKRSVPYLHYEIFELKSGLLMLHDWAPIRGPIKRFNTSPIQFLLPEKPQEAELSRLIRIHPLYKLSEEEKGVVWNFRYYLHFSSNHSLPLVVKCVDWMNPKMVEELHRLILQWDIFDPLLAFELLDANISDSMVRTFAVDCIRQLSDEELVTYMLQLVQALVIFEPYEDSALSRFLIERALRNRSQVGNALYWHLISLDGDSNVQQRINILTDSYLQASGREHSERLASQMLLLQHFRTLSARAAKLDSKAKLALLDAELQPDLFHVGEPMSVSSPRSPPTSPIVSPRKGGPPSAKLQSSNSSVNKQQQSTAAGDHSAAGSSSTPTKQRTWTLSKPSPALLNSKGAPSSPDNDANGHPQMSINHSGQPGQFVSQSFTFLNLPLDPSMCTRRIIKSKCKFMVSSAAPMWLVFDNADPLAAPTPAIFKSGDDLRQDILILQMLKLMDEIWQRDGLELHVSTYGCVATGKGEGFIEVVQDATTTGKIQKSFGASGALRKTPLASWLQQQHLEEPERLEEAIDNFVSSCAAYCIASYVLGLGDRHADNIMVTTMGNLFHIDFAHILGNIMRFGAYKRERAPFVLTPEFVFVMGDTKSARYARFVDLCLKGYNSLRRHTYLLIRLFKMMLSAGLPQFSDERELAYLYKSLSLGLTEQSAADKFAKLIDESRKTTTTLVNNFFHNLATGAVGAASQSSVSSSSSSGSGPRRLTTVKSTTSLLSNAPLSRTPPSKKGLR